MSRVALHHQNSAAPPLGRGRLEREGTDVRPQSPPAQRGIQDQGIPVQARRVKPASCRRQQRSQPHPEVLLQAADLLRQAQRWPFSGAHSDQHFTGARLPDNGQAKSGGGCQAGLLKCSGPGWRSRGNRWPGHPVRRTGPTRPVGSGAKQQCAASKTCRPHTVALSGFRRSGGRGGNRAGRAAPGSRRRRTRRCWRCRRCWPSCRTRRHSAACHAGCCP